MKKLIIIVSIILTGIIIYGVYSVFFKRTPEKVLKIMFNINLKDFDYDVETFEEKWCPNGDGQAFIILKINKLTQKNVDYLKGFAFKRLPISAEDSELMDFNEIPKEYFNVNTGYYIYEPLSNHDIRDYKILVVDTVKNIAILYYQYM